MTNSTEAPFSIPPISQTLSDIDVSSKQFDVVIVGSGYGGSIAASRLASAGKTVCLLERGQEIRPGSYPTDLATARKELTLVTARKGALDEAANGMMVMHVNDDVHVITGNGLGGGSLINAGVSIEPDMRVFKSGWPDAYLPETADSSSGQGASKKLQNTLSDYFDRVRTNLGAAKLPASKSLPKLTALEQSAKAMKQHFDRADINVTFETGKNAFQFDQAACNMCGDCCSGCNYGAKNTLLMNYLPDAKRSGATILTQVEVTTIAPDEDDWIVNVIDRTKPMPENTDGTTAQIRAGMVILAAGSLGSTRILARSRKENNLPLSEKLGQGFSANGDVLGFGIGANLTGRDGPNDVPTPLYSIGAGDHKPDGPPYQPGPCITGVIRVDMTDDKPLEVGMVIEDGTAPGALAAAYPPIMFLQGALTTDYSEFPDMQDRMESLKTLGEALQSGNNPATLSYDGVMTQMQSYLLMSHDSATGQLVYNEDSKQIFVDWPGAGSEASFLRDNDKLHEAADAIWANYIANPIWETGFGRNIVSVHPLGGCPMSDSDADGVTDADCHVYTGDGKNTVYDNLLVCDGSVVPRSLGVNPLLTISAITERAMDALIGQPETKAAASSENTIDEPSAEDQATSSPTNDWQEIAMAIGAACVMAESIVQACNGVVNYKNRILITGEVAAFFAGLVPNYSPSKLATFVYDFVPSDGWTDLGEAFNKVADRLRRLFTAALHVQNGGSDRAFLNTFIDVVGDVSPGFCFEETMNGHVSERRASQDDAISDPYEIAEGIGKADGRKLVANFTVSAASTLGRNAQKDVIANVANATLGNTVSLTDADGTVTEYTVADGGTFDLLPADATTVETWLMTYSCELMAPNATAPTWKMTGTKYLRQRSGSFWWQDLTTLFVDLTPVDPNEGKKAMQGIIRLDLQDLMAQMTTVSGGFGRAMSVADLKVAATTASGNKTLSAEIEKTAGGLLEKAFLTLLSVSAGGTADTWQVKLANTLEAYFGAGIAAIFADRVFRTYGGYAAYMADFASQSDVDFEPLPRPGIDTVQGSLCEHVALPDAKDPLIHLFHFAPPDHDKPAKGPILLAPGMSTTSLSFALNTIDTSLVDRLLSENYDVWLFDSRLSPPVMPLENGDKAPVKNGYTLDDIAAEDWPMAVDHVLKNTVVKGASIQVLGHCVGALTAQMALLGGHVETAKIRQLLLMQFTVHPAASWFNVMKSELGLADDFVNGFPPFVAKLVHAELGDGPAWDSVQDILTNGIPSINPVSPNPNSPDYQTPLDALHNTVDWNAPFGIDHVCLSPTCHRIYGLYGPVIAHKNLNEKTHTAMRHIFGEVATKPFEQLGLIMHRGRAVSSEGEDIYLPNFERLRLPLHIISGTINQIVLPESGFSTLHWLQTKMPKDAHLFTRTIIEGYAHNDCLIGKDANKDVFDGIMHVLDVHGAV